MAKQTLEKNEGEECPSTDTEVSRALEQLKTQGKIEDSTISRTLKMGAYIFIFKEGNISFLIGRGGRIVRSLSETLGSKVRILKDSKEVRDVIKDLLFPMRIKSYSEIYTKDGKSIKLALEGKSEDLPVSLEVIKELVHKLFSTEVEASFE
jgi:transcription antitermination factor NusA-like protein